ncbi:hypothetical protein Mapa_010515 [Marchantia paleacea]|nr:hypothetical protein Mapa_010515 [Marchantia paleacea]
MALILRSIGRRVLAAAPVAEEFSTGRVWIRIFRSFGTEPVTDTPQILKKRTVGVFWDLDNKPPKNVPPFKAATRLMEMAAGFGDVVDVVAYANHHAFSHVPTWVHEERKQRKMLDELEVKGLVKPEELYVCGVCGAKKKTRAELTKHFNSLHEREQKKRMNRLESLKGKKKQKERFWDNNVEKMAKYKEAARSIILPKVGYGLMQDLRRAGVYVRTVEDKPQAADIALKEHMQKSMKKGVKCICLVSDDSDFTPVLKMARERNLHTIVVGDLRVLSAYADTYFSWAEVASGIAEQKAKRETRMLMADFMDRLGGKLESNRYKGFGFDDDDLDEEDTSDSEAEFEDEKRWRRHDKIMHSEEEDQDFDFFSDDSSESDTDAELDSLSPRPRKLQSLAPGFTCRGVPKKSRGFSAERNVDTGDHSFNDIVSETDVRASLPKGSRGVPSKDKAVRKSPSSTDKSLETNLRVSVCLDADAKEDSPINEVTSSSVEASVRVKAESVDNIVNCLFDSSSTIEKETGIETDRKEPFSVQVFASDIDSDAVGLSDGERPSSHANIGRGRKKRKLFNEEEKRKKKPKNHFGGSSEGPIPVYMSGFASETEVDCERINSWYFEFWKDEENEYKGRRVNKHKKD